MEKKLGDKIRHRRKQLGLTLKDLAEDIVTPSQISAIEKGKCKPSYDLLVHIARRLGTDVEYFTLSEEEKHRKFFSSVKDKSSRLISEGDYPEALSILNGVENILCYLTYIQKGHFHYLRGECYYLQQKYSMAFDCYTSALGYFLKTKDVSTTANTYIKIANCLFNTDKTDLALGYYLKASEIINMDTEKDLTLGILFNLCVCYTKLKRYDLCRKLIAVFLQLLGDREGEIRDRLYAGIQMIIGVVNFDISAVKSFNSIFEKSFKVYESIMDFSGMGRAMHNNGVCMELLGEYKNAIENYIRSIDLKLECNDETLMGTYISLINLYKKIGDFEKVIEVINSAEEKMIQRNSMSELIDIFIIKFEYYSYLKQYDRAEVFAFLALDNVEKIFDKRKEFDIYIKLSDMYKRMGDSLSSIEFVIKANSLMA